jgi:hypothetical protein
MISAHYTLMEGSRVTVPGALDFLLSEAPALKPDEPPEGYNMLDDHAQALDLVLRRANAHQLPGPAFLRELATAVMQNTGRITNTVLGTWTLRRATCAAPTCLSPTPSRFPMPKGCHNSLWRQTIPSPGPSLISPLFSGSRARQQVGQNR